MGSNPAGRAKFFGRHQAVGVVRASRFLFERHHCGRRLALAARYIVGFAQELRRLALAVAPQPLSPGKCEGENGIVVVRTLFTMSSHAWLKAKVLRRIPTIKRMTKRATRGFEVQLLHVDP